MHFQQEPGTSPSAWRGRPRRLVPIDLDAVRAELRRHPDATPDEVRALLRDALEGAKGEEVTPIE
jgi:hypothetical protein